MRRNSETAKGRTGKRDLEKVDLTALVSDWGVDIERGNIEDNSWVSLLCDWGDRAHCGFLLGDQGKGLTLTSLRINY